MNVITERPSSSVPTPRLDHVSKCLVAFWWKGDTFPRWLVVGRRLRDQSQDSGATAARVLTCRNQRRTDRARSAAHALELSVLVQAQTELVESGRVGDRPSLCKHRLELRRMTVAAEREGVGLVGAQFTWIAHLAND